MENVAFQLEFSSSVFTFCFRSTEGRANLICSMTIPSELTFYYADFISLLAEALLAFFSFSPTNFYEHNFKNERLLIRVMPVR